MAKQYNNPNPSGKKVSSLDFGPTQDTVSNVDPNSLAGPPSGAEFMSAGMGQPGQLNFGADARSAFYRPVPKAMDNLLTPASQLVRTTVGALEQADQNALDKYGIEIDELKKQALDTSVPTSLHRINEEGVAEPNWDEVATQIEALNTKYESMFTIKGNLNIRTIGLRNRTENALKQGQNLETLWDKEFVRLTGAGYSATEIADEFDKWFAEIDDPYVHQALEKWKENTVVRYQAAIITSQNNAFTSAVDELTPFIMEEIQDPETYKSLFPNGIIDPEEAMELIINLYRAGIESDDSIAIAPNANGESGLDIVLENPKDPRTIALKKQVGKIIKVITDIEEEQTKQYNQYRVNAGIDLAERQPISRDDTLNVLDATQTADPNNKRKDIENLNRAQLTYHVTRLGNSSVALSNVISLGGYVDFFESQNPDTGPRQYEFGSPESINRYWNVIMADKMSLMDMDPKAVAGAGTYDGGGLAEELLQTSPESLAQMLNDVYGDEKYELLREAYYNSLPPTLSHSDRQNSWLTSVALSHGHAFELGSRSSSSRAGGGGGGGSDSGDEESEAVGVRGSLYSINTGLSKYHDRFSYDDPFYLQNLPLDMIREQIALERLGPIDFDSPDAWEKMSVQLSILKDLTDDELREEAAKTFAKYMGEDQKLTLEGRQKQMAYMQYVVYNNKSTPAFSEAMRSNLFDLPMEVWLGADPNTDPNFESYSQNAQLSFQFLRGMSKTQRAKFLGSDTEKIRLYEMFNGVANIKDANGNPMYDMSSTGMFANPSGFRRMFQLEADNPTDFTRAMFSGLAVGEMEMVGDTDPTSNDNLNFARLLDKDGKIKTGPRNLFGVTVDSKDMQALSSSLINNISNHFGIKEDDPFRKTMMRTLAFNLENDPDMKRHFTYFMKMTKGTDILKQGEVVEAWAQNVVRYLMDDMRLETDENGNPVFKLGNNKAGGPDGQMAMNVDWTIHMPDGPFDAAGPTQLTHERNAVEEYFTTPINQLPDDDAVALNNEFNRGMMESGIQNPTTLETINQYVNSQMRILEDAGYEVMIGDVHWARLQAYMKWKQFGSQNEQGFVDLLNKEMSEGSYEYSDGYLVDSNNEDSLMSYWRMDERFADSELQSGPRWYGLPLSRRENTDVRSQNRGFIPYGIKMTFTSLEGSREEIDASNIPSGIFSIPAYLWTSNYQGNYTSQPLSPSDMLFTGGVDPNRNMIARFIVDGDPSEVKNYINRMLGLGWGHREYNTSWQEIRRAVKRNPREAQRFISMYTDALKNNNPSDPRAREWRTGGGGNAGADWRNAQNKISAHDRALNYGYKRMVARETHTVPQLQEAKVREDNNRELRSMGYNLVTLGIKESGDYNENSVIAGLREDGPLNTQLQHALSMASGSLAPLDFDRRPAWRTRDRENYQEFKQWWSATDKTIPLSVMREVMDIDEDTQERKYLYFNDVYENLTDLEKETLTTRVGIPDRQSFTAAMLYADLFDKTSSLGSNVANILDRPSAYSKQGYATVYGGRMLMKVNGEIRYMTTPAFQRKQIRRKAQDKAHHGFRSAPKQVQKALLGPGVIMSNQDYTASWGFRSRLDKNESFSTWEKTDARYAQLVNEWAMFRGEARGGFGAEGWDWDEALDRFFQWKKIRDKQSK
tara:strand:+ start:119 stop:5020 length:4902 start_codon:yes stop_codon:yes gene_type:complete